jgi:hypothetical protein
MINLRIVNVLIFILCCALAVQGVAAHSENNSLDQLRADYAALLDARAELAEMDETCDICSEEQADFAAWINQLSEQFAETCRSVSSYSNESIPADIPCGEFQTTMPGSAGIDIQYERTDGEKTAAMVGQFNDSLGEFDEKLLREQDRVKSQKPLSSSANSTGGGAASGSDGEAGGASAQDSADGEQAQEGQQSDQQGSDQTATGARGNSSSGKQSTAPPDTPDGSDDDVIARQLREAAEKETDPELKKKLWEEYKRYKKG